MKTPWFYTANWIFVQSPPKEMEDVYFDYKMTFSPGDAEFCRIHISAHSNYALWINGAFVDCGQLPDYESRQIYDTLDIRSFLKPGENLLEITQYVAGRAFSTGRPAIPGVIFGIEADEKLIACSDKTVLSGQNCRYASLKEDISGQCGYNCAYDATGAATIFAPSVLVEKPKNLIPRPIHKVVLGAPVQGKLKTQGVFLENDSSDVKSRRMQSAYLSATLRSQLIAGKQTVSLWAGESLAHTDLAWKLPEGRKADGAYFLYDLGDEYAGFLDMELETPEICEVLIGYGEHLEDLRVRSNVHNRHFCFGFTAKPGKNRFFHPLQRIAGRYLQVHIYGKEGVLNRVSLIPADYPLNRLDVPVTDKLHRKIWEIGCKTLSLCMHEHYEDCPWREQALYSMDSRIQMLCGYYAFGEYQFPRESLRCLMESLRPDGLIELCAPGLVGLNIPGYTAIFPRQILEYTQYSGDLTLAEECFRGLTTIVETFRERIDETGLFPGHQGDQYWHFYDWRPGMHTLGVHEPGFYEAPMQVLVADSFRCYEEICKLLNKPLQGFACLADTLLKNTHKLFFDAQSGAYRTRPGEVPTHELTQALMLWSGAVPEDCKPSVEQAILGQRLIPASLAMTLFTYEALLQNPANREYVLRKMEAVWGKMLSAGAQTFWETEYGSEDFDRSGSLCHGWAAVPIYIFAKYKL